MTAVVFLKYAWGLIEKAKVYKSPTPSEKARKEAAREEANGVMRKLHEAIANLDMTSGSEAWAK